MSCLRFCMIIFVSIFFNVLLFHDLVAQPRGGGGRGGGGRGGGGQGGGPGGLRDLQGSRNQSPFADLPWDAQKLLEAHRTTLRKIPFPLQNYILASVKNWDQFFPIRQQQFEIFFEKAEKATRPELIEAFQEAMPPQFRTRQQSDGQRPRGQNRRGRGQSLREPLTPEQHIKLDHAFQNYVLPNQDITPGIIIILFTGKTGHTILSPAHLPETTHFTNVSMPAKITDALAQLQTGHTNPTKGKTLRVPSLFEYANHTLDDKTNLRTLAFYQSATQVPTVSKTKPYGKKFGPQTVSPAQLSDIAKTIDQELGEAKKQGKSQRYIDVMVKTKLTAEALKMKKVVKEPPMQALVLHTLLNNEKSRELGTAFIQTMVQQALVQALPDVFIAQLDKDTNTSTFLDNVITTTQNHPRYQNGATLAIIDHNTQQAWVKGPHIASSKTIENQETLANIVATVAQSTKLHTPHINGQVVSSALKTP